MHAPVDQAAAPTAGEPSSPLPGSRWQRLHWMVWPLLGVTLLLFLRRSDLFVRPQFWAEDATILFQQARDAGWRCLFTPYPTYFVVAQRLVACLAAGLPARSVPWVYCYAALAYTLLTAWFCLRARLDYLLDRRGRIALALALVLVPHSGEVFMKLINAQWMLMPILMILILQDQPARRGQAVVDFLGLVIVGLTGPFIVFYAPWFLVRLRRVTGGRSRYNLALIGTAWAVAAVQVLSMARQPLPHEPFPHDALSWLRQLGFMLPGGLFLGANVPYFIGRPVYVISVLLLALLGWALWRAEPARRWAVVTLLGCGGIAYAGGLQRMASAVFFLSPFEGAARYFYPFYLAAMWTGVVFSYAGSGRLRLAARVALAMMLLACASAFTGQAWPDLHWEKYTQPLDAGQAVQGVPILPDWSTDFPAKK